MEGEENKKINIMTNGKKWYGKDNIKLIELYQLGYTFPEIAAKMDRSRFAVKSKMYSLACKEEPVIEQAKAKQPATNGGYLNPIQLNLRITE